MLTVRQIREAISYDPETGIAIRLSTGSVLVGRNLSIDGGKFVLSRCLWLHFYGEWPSEDKQVDHIDRNPYNNKISNLRLATNQENSYNKESPYNLNGYKGIYDCGRKSKPWQAQIRINGVKTNLGRFETREEAAEAYKRALLESHGSFANTEGTIEYAETS